MRKIATILILAFTLLTSGLALAHDGHKHGPEHLMGTVTAVSADQIEIKTKEGKAVTVPLTKETKYFKGDQQAAQADVKAGARVIVHLGDKGAAKEVRLGTGNQEHAEHGGH
jgi:hypothetical protein